MTKKVADSIEEANRQGLARMETRKGKTAVKILKAVEEVQRRDKAHGRN